MNRAAYEEYIRSQYGVMPDCPFSDGETTVFRHPGNRKWFALVMRIRRDRLIPGADGEVDVVNLKIEPLLGGAIRQEPGIYPAYHMNKEKWITAVLDGMAAESQLTALTEMSYSLTAPKTKQSGSGKRREENAPV